MREITLPQGYEDAAFDRGCAYLLDRTEGRRICGAPCRAASSYCPEHHALCYIACGTDAEARRLREVETLASSVGGRRGRPGLAPPRRFLERLEGTVRNFS